MRLEVFRPDHQPFGLPGRRRERHKDAAAYAHLGPAAEEQRSQRIGDRLVRTTLTGRIAREQAVANDDRCCSEIARQSWMLDVQCKPTKSMA